jgi:hypothetical protein
MRDLASMIRRARGRYLRRLVLGAVMIGALAGAMLHVMRRATSSVVQGAPAPAAPSQPDAIARTRPTDAPRAEAAPAPGTGSGPGAAQLPRVEQARRDDASPKVQPPRPPAPAPARPPAKGGMRIIDLRPETPELEPTGRARRSAREIDLGPIGE